MTTCLDCGDDHPIPHVDPRNPPLDIIPCLCRDCYISAILEVFDASLEDLRDVMELLLEITKK